MGKVQGAGEGSLEIQTRAERVLQVASMEGGRGGPAFVGRQVVSCQREKRFPLKVGRILMSISPTSLLLVVGRASPGPKALGSLHGCTALWFWGRPGPQRSLARGPTLDGPCLLWGRLLLEMRALSPFPLLSKAKARSGKLQTSCSRRIKWPASQGKFYKPVMSMVQGEDRTV